MRCDHKVVKFFTGGHFQYNNNGGNNTPCYSNARQTTAAAHHPGNSPYKGTGTTLVVYATQCVTTEKFFICAQDTLVVHVREKHEENKAKMEMVD